VWYRASRVWPEEREVRYANDVMLVPLLPNEVPFGYDDLGSGMVFLWDRRDGVATASHRFAASVPLNKLRSFISAYALYGSAISPPGYCYEAMFDGDASLGPFPTARELRARQAVCDFGGVTFRREAEGRYHCSIGGRGVTFDQVPDSAVVGAAVPVLGFGPAGVEVGADAQGFYKGHCDRVAAVGGGCVELDAEPDTVASSSGSSVCPVRWISSELVSTGLNLNTGLVTRSEDDTAYSCAVVSVDRGVRKVYCASLVQGRYVVRSYCARGGMVLIPFPQSLSSVLVYSLTVDPAAEVGAHPVEYSGEPLLHCLCGNCASERHQEGRCYELCTPAVFHSFGVTLNDLAKSRLYPDRVLQGLWLTRTGSGRLHLAERGEASFLSAVRAMRSGVSLGTGLCKLVVSGADLVGGLSPTAELLHRDFSGLLQGSPEEWDTAGAWLAGSATSVLDSSQKDRLRVMQAVGDNVISLLLSLRVLKDMGTAQYYQETRSRVSSNAYLTRVHSKTEYASVFVGQSKPLPPKTGGGAVEALFAVVYSVLGIVGAESLMSKLDIG